MAKDYLKHSNRTAQSIQLTGKYFWTTPKSIKPIIIHTTNVNVEMMMINGTKYPLNRSASCWMGAYENKTPRPWEITIHKEICPHRHGQSLGFWAPVLTRLLIALYSAKSAWVSETLGITSKLRNLTLCYFLTFFITFDIWASSTNFTIWANVVSLPTWVALMSTEPCAFIDPAITVLPGFFVTGMASPRGGEKRSTVMHPDPFSIHVTRQCLWYPPTGNKRQAT